MKPDTSRMVTLLAPRWSLYKELLSFVDMDLTSAAYKMQVRTAWNTGSLLLDLGTAATSTATGLRTAMTAFDTIANHILNGYMNSVPPGYTSSDLVRVSLVSIRVPKTIMVTIPNAEDPTEDYEAVYDIWITPSGGDEERYLRGPFIIESGSTQ